jgi:ADP-ribose pyrophosphatase YjhB (NUDIX family)
MMRFVSIPEHSRSLSPADWEWASARLPIACVDVLLVQRGRDRHVQRVGLILRDSPFGPRWCHIGGRVLHDEELRVAAHRHLDQTLTNCSGARIQAEPYFVNQYFPEAREGMGLDPRKHAIATCYVVEVPPDVHPVPTGHEGSEFKWFSIDEIRAEARLWPGTILMIDQPGIALDSHGLESYAALTTRCVSHNELMWQTPALAMTAMAFLLTIGLGDSDNWKRSLAAGLACLVAIVSAQLMARHSRSQIADSDALSGLETRLRMLPVNQKPVEQVARRTANILQLQVWLADRRSRVWWFRALLLFAAALFVKGFEASGC